MKTIAARALGSSFVIVALLTFFEYRTASAAFFYLLYPGSVLSMLITGGHGGTKFEEGTALVASLIVNTLVYAVLFAGVLASSKRAGFR
jgi:hypothetical protein